MSGVYSVCMFMLIPGVIVQMIVISLDYNHISILYSGQSCHLTDGIFWSDWYSVYIGWVENIKNQNFLKALSNNGVEKKKVF